MLKPRIEIKQDRNTGRLIIIDQTGSFDPIANEGGYGEINTTAGQATATLTIYRATNGSFAAGTFSFPAILPCKPQTLMHRPLEDGAYLFDYQVSSRFGVPVQKCSYRVSDKEFAAGNRFLIGIEEEDGVIAWVDKTDEAVITDGLASWSSYMTASKYSLWRITSDNDEVIEEGDLIQFDCFRSALDGEERAEPELVGASLTAYIVDHNIRRKIAQKAIALNLCERVDDDRRMIKWAQLYYEYNELLAMSGSLPPLAIEKRFKRLHQLADRIC